MSYLMDQGALLRGPPQALDRPNPNLRIDLIDELAEWVSHTSWTDKLMDFAKWGLYLGLGYYISLQFKEATKKILGALKESEGAPPEYLKALARRLKKPEIETLTFDSYEYRLMDDIVGSDEIDVTFEDIGGLENELDDVKDNIVFPFRLWNMKLQGSIPSCPTGVLLYGQPGTGKTMIAKALAKECQATFISIKSDMLMDKWLGESDKLAGALFKLGRKLAPSIIFMDEVETLLSRRGNGQSLASAVQTMQGVLLSEWDGLSGDSSQAPVVVLGATNRPMDLDKAFLRRMPVRIQTRMPEQKARASILQALLKKELLAEELNIDDLADDTEGYSGSDLRELVRVAVLQRTKSLYKALLAGVGEGELSRSKVTVDAALLQAKKEGLDVPAISVADFEYALRKCHSGHSGIKDYSTEINQAQTHIDLAKVFKDLGLSED